MEYNTTPGTNDTGTNKACIPAGTAKDSAFTAKGALAGPTVAPGDKGYARMTCPAASGPATTDTPKMAIT
jgi:hypothetical protein